MKKRVRENLILTTVVIVVIVVCVSIVALAYVWKYGMPDFTKSSEIVDGIASGMKNTDEYINMIENKNNNIKIETIEDTIYVYNTKESISIYEEDTLVQSIAFVYEDNSFTAVINETEVDSEFKNSSINMLFMANAINLGYSKDNASYSLIPELLNNKTYEADGYELLSEKGITTFRVSTEKILNLATKDDIYIKESDLTDKIDILKNKLKYIIIEKPQIVFEKNTGYSSKMQYVIYEKGALTKRAYESLMTLIKVVTASDTSVRYVRENYPVITQEGTISLAGITISLNENINQGFHYYDMKEDDAYMRITIDVEKLSQK